MGGRSCLSQDLTRTCLGLKSTLMLVIHKTSRQGQEQVKGKVGPRQGRWRVCRLWWLLCDHLTCSPIAPSPAWPQSAGLSPRPPPPSPCKGTQRHNCLAVSWHCSWGQPRTPAAVSFLLCVLMTLALLSGCRHKTPLAPPLARCRSSRRPSLFFCGTTWQGKWCGNCEWNLALQLKFLMPGLRPRHLKALFLWLFSKQQHTIVLQHYYKRVDCQ